MKHPNDCTIAELKARLNNGQSMLTEASKQAFQLAFSAHMAEVKRSKMLKADYVAALTMLASCYRAQQVDGVAEAAEQAFDYKTASFAERARHRAAQIRIAMAAAKDEAVKSGRAVKIKLPKISWS